MPRPIAKARRAVVLREPRVSPTVLGLASALSPHFLRLGLGIRRVDLLGGEDAVRAYRDFHGGKKRLIVAFRHSYGDEPQVMAHTLLRVLPRFARAAGTPLDGSGHAHFVHGYEVPLWGGPLIRALLPRVGAVPVHHTKLDTPSIARIRRLMVDGEHPLALAPEGQTSYTSRSVPRLERGFAHIAAWALDDLSARGRAEGVEVLPLSLHYRYGPGAEASFERVMAPLEDRLGISARRNAAPSDRLSAAAEALTAAAERRYRERHREAFRHADGDALLRPVPAGERNRRWSRVLETALLCAEGSLGIAAAGDAVQRVYRIRHECWDRIYSLTAEGLPSILDGELADRTAGEAWYAMGHMELADLGYYLDLDGPTEDDDLDGAIERGLNLWDAVSRLRGGNFSCRPVPGPRRAVVVAAEALDMGPLMAPYGKDRRAAAEAAAEELSGRYRSCIERYEQEYLHG